MCSLLGRFLGRISKFLLTCDGGIVHHRGTDEDGCISSDADTDDECDCKTPDGLTSPDRDCEHGNEGGDRSVDRTGKGSVQRQVGVGLDVGVRMQGPVLTDTVEDNHVIVDSISDDSQDSRDERLVNVKVERQDTGEQ